MPKIVQLDRHVADLIAAGEVVERPASCVKELVENAVDAGAHAVTVEIQNGGMRFIRVTDDGCGMSPEDAETAFLRHATSKLRTKEDLAAISTLGFRGEALAAISSVSRIDLLTRMKDAEGVSLHLEGGVVTERESAGCPEGTSIIVRDLFFNTPARMKFMKSDQAEGSAVTLCVQQQALAHPDVAIRLLKDGEEVFHTDGRGDRLAAVYSVFGRDLANSLLPVSSTWEKTQVGGFVTKQTATRGNRAMQMFFVNGRFVRSKLLSSALEEAYRNQIAAGRFPACVLEVRLPVGAVDVNVHPAKTEVKFLNERDVFDAVHYAVLATLNHVPAGTQMRLPERKAPEAPSAPAAPAAAKTPQPDFFRTMQAEEYRRQAEKAPAAQRPPRVAEPVAVPRSAAQPVPPLFSHLPPAPAYPAPPQKLPNAPAVPPKPVKAAQKPQEPEAVPEQQTLPIPEEPFRVVGEVLNTYIIAECGGEVLFIDQHAAHERINFERLRAQQGSIMSQQLLAPMTARLTKPEAAAVLENSALLAECGFAVEDFGGGDVLVRAVPADVAPEQAQALLQQLAGDLLTGKTPDAGNLRDRLLHSIACKAAIKGGWKTAQEEREYLVKEVLSREDLRFCPHGRPICISLSQKQLEKQFGRA